MPYSYDGLSAVHNGECSKETLIVPKDDRQLKELLAKGCAQVAAGAVCCGRRAPDYLYTAPVATVVPEQLPSPELFLPNGQLDPAQVMVTEQVIESGGGIVDWIKDHPVLSLGLLAVVVGGVAYMRGQRPEYAATVPDRSW